MNQPIRKRLFSGAAGTLALTVRRATPLTATRAAMMLLMMMLTTMTAWADITPTAPTQDADGYYLIGTAAELYGFAEIVNNGNATANGKLTADIVVNENVLDANGESNTGNFVQWTPIGNDDQNTTYSGTFDGQGHTISGLYVSGSGWYVGLIGKVGGVAVVKNVGIVDSYFSSSNNMLGSIVGGVSYSSSVTLANVYSTSTVKGDNWIGGLVGGAGDGSVAVINSYFAGKTSASWSYGAHHDDLVSGGFGTSGSGTLDVVNTFVVGTSQYGTSVTAGQLSDGTVAAALHYYQDALADGSMFGINDGKTTFSGSLEGVSVTTADITLHTFDGDATAYSSKYVVGITTPLPVNVVREGYTFLGWYDNADLEGDAVTSISSSETGSKEYWAKFERSHSVTFVLNDGYIQTGEIDHYIEGETTALPTMVFKDGASFEGWYTTEDFTGDRYYSIPATATEDMTFYAKWGAAKTTFYLVQGGSPESVNVLYEGENVVYLDKTTMDGYYVRDEDGNYWGGFGESIDVPYTGGESTFGNGGRAFNVAQSGFYVFTLTDKGDGNWFISVLYSLADHCTVSDIPDQTYTGSAIEPTVVVTNGETTLTLDTDYTIEYSDNTNAGTATVTIKGKGNYSGTVEKTFTIVPKPVTVTADNKTKEYGDDDPTLTATVEGLIGEGAITYTLSRIEGEAVGTYDIIPAGDAAQGNYAVTFVAGTMKITTKVTVSGGLTIAEDQNGKTATLDGSSLATLSIPTDITVKSVSLDRTFTSGTAVTLMLPFSLGDEQTLTGGTLYKFSGVSKDTNGKWQATMTETATLKANTPYMMMPDDNLSAGKLMFDLNNSTTTLNTTTTGENSSTNSDWEFKGTYEERHWYDGTDAGHPAENAAEIGKVYGFAATSGKATDGVTDIAAGQFVRFASGAWLRPMRCYLEYKGAGNPLAAARRSAAATDTEVLPQSITVVLVGLNGETTAIGSLDTRTGQIDFGGWWTLDGTRLQGKPSQRGVYINKGRKVIIK